MAHARRIDMASSAPSGYDHTEGKVARRIEQQTANPPSDTFLWAAGASIAASAALQAVGKRHARVSSSAGGRRRCSSSALQRLLKELGCDALDRDAEV